MMPRFWSVEQLLRPLSLLCCSLACLPPLYSALGGTEVLSINLACFPRNLIALLALAQGLTACPSATASFLAAAGQLAFTTATKADAGGRGGAAGVGFHAAVGGPVLPTEVQEATYWQHDTAAAAASQSVRFAQPFHSFNGCKSRYT